MIAKLSDWLDHRTGYRKFVHTMLLEEIPGGAKWRYVWGSCLAFVFMLQLITGVLLMTSYSPGDSTAWGSVYYIQYQMDFGWLIRGLHHFGSQTMVVLLGLHMLQVVIAGAHLPPREVNWWLGLILLSLTLGLGLTGYLLPWDQKGYFATQVATNIASNIPVIGESLQKIIVGGPVYGNHTLTRFFTLHVWVLPFSLIIFLVLHLVAFRRHGVTYPKNAKGEGWFWPDQAFRDLIMCLIIFGIMLSVVVFGGHGTKIEGAQEELSQGSTYEYWAKAGQRGLGANLDAPADPETAGYPARPEWYFLFLFQLLKYFEGDLFLVGTLIIPNAAMVLLFLLPLFGYGRMRPFGHIFGIIAVVGLLGSVAVLTALAMSADTPGPWPGKVGPLELNVLHPRSEEDRQKAEGFQHNLEKAAKEAERAINLAAAGIPDEGGRELLRADPLSKGGKLFQLYCGACHDYTVAPGQTVWHEFKTIHNKPARASDLGGFGNAHFDKWIRGLLSKPDDPRYFGFKLAAGESPFKTMIEWRKKLEEARKDLSEDKIAVQEKELDDISKWLADQQLPVAKRDKDLEKRGKEAFFKKTKDGGVGCYSCHTVGDEGGDSAPNHTNYGSQDWIRMMIMAPQHSSRYGDKNKMPAFRNLDGPGSEVTRKEFEDAFKDTKLIHLSDVDRELIIRWITGDFRVAFGGRPIAGAPRKD